MTDGLSLEGVRIALRGVPLVSLDVRIAPGEVLTIMGPSGSGKSTLLSLLVGACPPEFETRGRVLLGGRDLAGLGPRERRIGLLFQDDLLFPHMSVGANLAFALPPSLKGRRARRRAVEAALEDAELASFADRDPATLSGGQRSRVALMRTLLGEPQALLLDEPFSRLDANLRESLRGFVFDRIRARGIPALLVTHDAEDAAAAGGRVVDPLGRGAGTQAKAASLS
ncbi:ATP-binding cassette domain-containing protein [Tropicimonas sp. IMCC34011]|uniref:ATP-binding cassette domain-containing protein n=1 Tax=Tropicimonas sp. IMCC34011 TaxID=2248759 RepID=UPI000E26C1FA|nr:ATP-binding cassette domain-containing protein [Tropicimonas sp. IMCC34011]